MTAEPIVSRWRRAIRDDETLSADAKATGYVLSTYARVDGSRCFPGGDLLVRGTGRSLRSVRRGTSELRERGYALEVVRGAPGRASEYRLIMPTRATALDDGTGTRAHAARVYPLSSARDERTSVRSDSDECHRGTPTSHEQDQELVTRVYGDEDRRRPPLVVSTFEDAL